MNTSNSIRSISNTVRNQVEGRLSPGRAAHVFRVVDTAVAIADRFGVDVLKVELAALVHDIDRESGTAEMLARAADFGIDLNALERRWPVLAHGAVAAHRLRTEFGCCDDAVLSAVHHHTLGHPDLDEVGRVLYVADFVEPGRKHLSESDRDDVLGRRSLPAMTARVIELSQRRFGDLHPCTRALYERVRSERA